MRRDDGYVLDMLLACRAVREYVAGETWESFQANRMRQDAVMHQIQIIGEAARAITDQYRDAHPEIPWRGIIGMRHQLVHRYFAIEVPLVWRTATIHVVDLLSILESLTERELSQPGGGPPEENGGDGTPPCGVG